MIVFYTVMHGVHSLVLISAFNKKTISVSHEAMKVTKKHINCLMVWKKQKCFSYELYNWYIIDFHAIFLFK